MEQTQKMEKEIWSKEHVLNRGRGRGSNIERHSAVLLKTNEGYKLEGRSAGNYTCDCCDGALIEADNDEEAIEEAEAYVEEFETEETLENAIKERDKALEELEEEHEKRLKQIEEKEKNESTKEFEKEELAEEMQEKEMRIKEEFEAN